VYEPHDPYRNLREILAPEYANLPPQAVEAVFRASLGPGVSAEDLEDFWGSLRNFGNQVVQAAPTVLPGVIQGATTGAALGPWGALAGGIAGGAMSYLQRGQQPPAAPQPMPTPGAAPGISFQPGLQPAVPAGFSQAGGFPVPASGPAGAPGVGGAPASAQLLATLLRPEMIQALLSILVGQPAARSSVPVGNVAVPAGAFPNLLGVLANQASAEAAVRLPSQRAVPPSYMMNSEGSLVGDPDDPVQRAGRLLELFKEADQERAVPVAPRPARQWPAYEYEATYDEDLQEDTDGEADEGALIEMMMSVV